MRFPNCPSELVSGRDVPTVTPDGCQPSRIAQVRTALTIDENNDMARHWGTVNHVTGQDM